MAQKRTKPLPKGRVRRTAKVGGLVGGQAARGYATRAANLTRSDEGAAPPTSAGRSRPPSRSSRCSGR